ncbi:Aste57867_21770 [Aphanomyces stellatus]|uniref:Aste57867_21770 protein n=1 Tax=Aphanomyces stellatus TaxID=120398 RepID=A0A485LJ23_9STRA|nr:hypothetical protein As57867_021701 [Aphanomyces stellatus]VFT98439.1 Aste57867_21770 [Aphanomyces stellatus]
MASTTDTVVDDQVITLTSGHAIHCTRYGAPDAASTLIMMHGAPGSHADFRHLAPLVVRDGDINVLAMDLPGNGRTSADAAGGTHLTQDHIVDAVTEAIASLATPSSSVRHRSRLFVLGHSMGGQVAIQVAAASPKTVCGLALLSSAGLEPLASQRPLWLLQCVAWLLTASPITRYFATLLTRLVYVYMLGFPTQIASSDFVVAAQRGATQNSTAIAAGARVIRERGLPTFMAYATNDRMVTPAMGDALANVLEPETKLVFATGGHNLQKTKADELAHALVNWMRQSNPTPAKL